MTYFFDIANAEVSRLPGMGDAAFLAAVAEVESPIARWVSLCVGDREFPDDLRDRALKILACDTVRQIAGLPPLDEVARYVVATRTSVMLHNLHGLFHEVAGRDLRVRFGRLSDDPESNVNRRDRHAAETYRGVF